MALAEAKLASAPGLEVLERRDVYRILDEQKLSLTALVDPGRSLAVGKLLAVDLFAVVEVEATDNQVLGVIVFEAKTGVRLCDLPLAADSMEGRVDRLVATVLAAAEKSRLAKERRQTLCVLAVRNADLPGADGSLCPAVRVLLERRLLQAPAITLLERSHLSHVSDEQTLPAEQPATDLTAAGKLVDVELARLSSTGGVRAVAIVSNVQGERLHLVTVQTAESDAAAIAEALALGLAKALAQPLPALQVADRNLEARRFHYEGRVLLGNGLLGPALAVTEAACALQPDAPDMEATLVNALVKSAAHLLQVQKPDVQSANGMSAPASPAAVGDALRQAIRAVDVRHRAFRRASRELNYKLMQADSRRNYWGSLGGRFANLVTDLAGACDASQDRELNALMERLRLAWTGLLDDVIRQWTAVRQGQEDASSFRPTHSFFKELSYDNFRVLGAVSRSSTDYVDTKLRAADGLMTTLANPFDESQVFGWMDNIVRLIASCDAVPRQRRLKPDDWRKLQAFFLGMGNRHPHPVFLYGALGGEGQVATAAGTPLPPTYAADLQKLRKTLKACLRDPHYALSPQTRARLGEAHFNRGQLYTAYFHTLEWDWTGETAAERDAAAAEMIRYMHEKGEAVHAMLYRLAGVQKNAPDRWPEVLRQLASIEQWLARDEVISLDGDKIQLMEGLRALRSPILQARPDLSPQQAAAPWREMRQLFPANASKVGANSEGGFLYFPLLDNHDAVIVALADHWGHGTLKLLRIPLAGGEPEHLNTAACDGYVYAGGAVPPRANGSPSAPLTAESEGYKKISGTEFSGAGLDAEYYCLTTRNRGLLVLPLNGTPSRWFDMSSGLLTNDLANVAVLDGIAYVSGDGYLFGIDLKTGETAVLASSRRKLKASPFDDGLPFRIGGMTTDPAKQRLLLLVAILTPFPEPRDSHCGIWEYSPAAKRFTQLADLSEFDIPMYQVWSMTDPHGLFLFGRDCFQAYDMRTDQHQLIWNNHKRDQDHYLWEKKNLIHTQAHLGSPYALIGNAFWSYLPLARVSAGSGVVEEFQRPPGGSKGWVEPHFHCLQVVGDGTRLLYGDGQALWLLSPSIDK